MISVRLEENGLCSLFDSADLSLHSSDFDGVEFAGERQLLPLERHPNITSRLNLPFGFNV